VANHKSAVKQHRRSLRQRQRNRPIRARMRTAVKRFRGLVETDPEAARTALPTTLGLIDRTAKLGVVHANAAARTKSRLARALNAKIES
jgi:small subunit ribosomal protein S20